MDLPLRGEISEIMTRVVVMANALNCRSKILSRSFGRVVVFRSKMVFLRSVFLYQFVEY